MQLKDAPFAVADINNYYYFDIKTSNLQARKENYKYEKLLKI